MNDFELTFVFNDDQPREWLFFPVMYIILVFVFAFFYVTIRLFVKQIRIREQDLDLANIELTRTVLLLEESNSQLAISNSTKDRFFSIISHDLRNPMTAMVNISSVFVDYYHNMSLEDAYNYISILSNSTSHLSRLLDNLLNWSRLNLSTLNVDLVKYGISDLVSLSLDDVRVQAEDKRISLLFENNSRCIVYCDIDMINTVLRNLLSNAIKFSDKYAKVTVIVNDYKEDTNFVEVVVKDEGVGIDSEDLGKLFRLDEKFSTLGTLGELGTGLGLILCKEFIERHNCHIWVESVLGVGTSFHFTLPKWLEDN